MVTDLEESYVSGSGGVRSASGGGGGGGGGGLEDLTAFNKLLGLMQVSEVVTILTYRQISIDTANRCAAASCVDIFVNNRKSIL